MLIKFLVPHCVASEVCSNTPPQKVVLLFVFISEEMNWLRTPLLQQ